MRRLSTTRQNISSIARMYAAILKALLFSPFALALLTLTVTLPAATFIAPVSGVVSGQAPGQTAKYLVLISVDGCRPEYLDLALMPNLKALAAQGTSYSRAWVGALSSNTPAMHTTMSTGVFPKRHGIIAFFWNDSDTGTFTNPTTFQAIANGDMARIVEQIGGCLQSRRDL